MAKNLAFILVLIPAVAAAQSGESPLVTTQKDFEQHRRDEADRTRAIELEARLGFSGADSVARGIAVYANVVPRTHFERPLQKAIFDENIYNLPRHEELGMRIQAEAAIALRTRAPYVTPDQAIYFGEVVREAATSEEVRRLAVEFCNTGTEAAKKALVTAILASGSATPAAAASVPAAILSAPDTVLSIFDAAVAGGRLSVQRGLDTIGSVAGESLIGPFDPMNNARDAAFLRDPKRLDYYFYLADRDPDAARILDTVFSPVTGEASFLDGPDKWEQSNMATARQVASRDAPMRLLSQIQRDVARGNQDIAHIKNELHDYLESERKRLKEEASKKQKQEIAEAAIREAQRTIAHNQSIGRAVMGIAGLIPDKGVKASAMSVTLVLNIHSEVVGLANKLIDPTIFAGNVVGLASNFVGALMSMLGPSDLEIILKEFADVKQMIADLSVQITNEFRLSRNDLHAVSANLLFHMALLSDQLDLLNKSLAESEKNHRDAFSDLRDRMRAIQNTERLDALSALRTDLARFDSNSSRELASQADFKECVEQIEGFLIGRLEGPFLNGTWAHRAPRAMDDKKALLAFSEIAAFENNRGGARSPLFNGEVSQVLAEMYQAYGKDVFISGEHGPNPENGGATRHFAVEPYLDGWFLCSSKYASLIKRYPQLYRAYDVADASGVTGGRSEGWRLRRQIRRNLTIAESLSRRELLADGTVDWDVLQRVIQSALENLNVAQSHLHDVVGEKVRARLVAGRNNFNIFEPALRTNALDQAVADVASYFDREHRNRLNQLHDSDAKQFGQDQPESVGFPLLTIMEKAPGTDEEKKLFDERSAYLKSLIPDAVREGLVLGTVQSVVFEPFSFDFELPVVYEQRKKQGHESFEADPATNAGVTHWFDAYRGGRRLDLYEARGVLVIWGRAVLDNNTSKQFVKLRVKGDSLLAHRIVYRPLSRIPIGFVRDNQQLQKQAQLGLPTDAYMYDGKYSDWDWTPAQWMPRDDLKAKYDKAMTWTKVETLSALWSDAGSAHIQTGKGELQGNFFGGKGEAIETEVSANDVTYIAAMNEAARNELELAVRAEIHKLLQNSAAGESNLPAALEEALRSVEAARDFLFRTKECYDRFLLPSERETYTRLVQNLPTRDELLAHLRDESASSSLLTHENVAKAFQDAQQAFDIVSEYLLSVPQRQEWMILEQVVTSHPDATRAGELASLYKVQLANLPVLPVADQYRALLLARDLEALHESIFGKPSGVVVPRYANPGRALMNALLNDKGDWFQKAMIVCTAYYAQFMPSPSTTIAVSRPYEQCAVPSAVYARGDVERTQPFGLDFYSRFRVLLAVQKAARESANPKIRLANEVGKGRLQVCLDGSSLLAEFQAGETTDDRLSLTIPLR